MTDEHPHGPHADHDHHDHGHDHERGLRKVFAQIFRPHSHDAADSIDDALEASERGVHAVKVSFVALMVTALVQLVVVVIDGLGGAARRHDPQLL